jgi:GT2 family glycosyltransferase
MKRGGTVSTLSGAFMMVPKRLWDELEGFDETFFMYNEESELCHRIRKLGYSILLTPDARITHLVGAGSHSSPQRLTAMMRGRMQFARKHYGPVGYFTMGAITFLHAASRYAAGSVFWPVLGRSRAAVMRERFGPILRHPSNCWQAY